MKLTKMSAKTAKKKGNAAIKKFTFKEKVKTYKKAL